jgi:hypothetical protein
MAGRSRWRQGATRLSRRTLAALVLFGATGVGLAACGGPYAYFGYTTSTGAHTYFKVPSNWKVLDTMQFLRLAEPNAPFSTLYNDAQGQWVTVAVQPPGKLSSGNPFSTNHVVAIVWIRQLTPQQELSGYTAASLRGFFFGGTDPVADAEQGDPAVQLVNEQSISAKGGLSGDQFTVILANPNGGSSVEMEQKGLLDQANGYIYVLGIGCSESCFNANSRVIRTVVDSWHVEGS